MSVATTERGPPETHCYKVGFCNIAIHDYQQLQLPILRRILDERLGDFNEFTACILKC